MRAWCAHIRCTRARAGPSAYPGRLGVSLSLCPLHADLFTHGDTQAHAHIHACTHTHTHTTPCAHTPWPARSPWPARPACAHAGCPAAPARPATAPWALRHAGGATLYWIGACVYTRGVCTLLWEGGGEGTGGWCSPGENSFCGGCTFLRRAIPQVRDSSTACAQGGAPRAAAGRCCHGRRAATEAVQRVRGGREGGISTCGSRAGCARGQAAVALASGGRAAQGGGCTWGGTRGLRYRR